MIFWVKEADIDGFRCDVAGRIPVDFWNQAVPEIKKVKPVFMLAECDKPIMHDTAFDMTYSWDLYKLMHSIATGKKNALAIDSLWVKEDTLYPADSYLMRFTSNHDKNSWDATEYEWLGDAAQTFAVMTFTVPGMPLIYSGQEAASKRRLKFFDKDTIDWDSYMLSGFYSTLADLKKSNKALWNGNAGGSLTRIHTNREKEVYAFMREKDGNKVLVVLNLTPGLQNVDLFDHKIIGNYTNAFTGESLRLEDEVIFHLKPWEYIVLYNKVR